ncbi:MAG TPA: hypothetical protein PL106_00430, partial [Flavobacteriales bacterium]|nr:hypothetical protein [Flavobacteriales bacterium]
MATSTDEQLRELTKGQTVPTEFLKTVTEYGSSRALRWMEGEDWKELTFSQLADQAARVAAGLAAGREAVGAQLLA